MDRQKDCQSLGQKIAVTNQMVRTSCAQTVPAKRLYSIKELVAFFGVTPWYWRSQIWAGLLPYVQVGRKMVIDHKDVESFINRNKISNM
jgi:hypothetical protein